MPSHPSLSPTVSHTPSLEKKKSLIHIPPPPASTLLRGESTKAFCSSGDAARAVFLTAAYPPSPLLAKHRHQTVSIKPKQVPLTERPLFRLCGVHTWASVAWTRYRLAPNAQVDGAIKTHIKDAFFHSDGWKCHGCSTEKCQTDTVSCSHRSQRCSLASKLSFPFQL